MLAAYRCQACNFDYMTLATDDAARERWMLEGLRGPAHERLAVLAGHRVIMQLPPAESIARVRAFAAQHGIPLPPPRVPMSGRKMGLIIVVLAVLFLGAGALLIALGGHRA
jgi:hypothetical protein